jgi:hypothetical protein
MMISGLSALGYYIAGQYGFKNDPDWMMRTVYWGTWLAAWFTYIAASARCSMIGILALAFWGMASFSGLKVLSGIGLSDAVLKQLLLIALVGIAARGLSAVLMSPGSYYRDPFRNSGFWRDSGELRANARYELVRDEVRGI